MNFRKENRSCYDFAYEIWTSQNKAFHKRNITKCRERERERDRENFSSRNLFETIPALSPSRPRRRSISRPTPSAASHAQAHQLPKQPLGWEERRRSTETLIWTLLSPKSLISLRYRKTKMERRKTRKEDKSKLAFLPPVKSQYPESRLSNWRPCPY